MKNLIASLLLCLPAFAGQSFLPTATATATFPAGYPAITAMSWESAYDVIGPCLSNADFVNTGTNRTPNIVDIGVSTNAAIHHLGLGCLVADGTSKALGIGQPNGNPGQEILTHAQMSGVTTLVMRQSWDVAGNRRVIEAWDQNGVSLYPAPYYLVLSGGVSAISSLASPATRARFMMAQAGILKTRWMRLYSTIPLTYGTVIPKDSFAATGDLGNWNFEAADISGANTILDTSGRSSPVNITHTGSTCSPAGQANCFTPSLAPTNTIVQASISAGSAGGTVTVDASQSFRWDDTAPAGFEWRYGSGPSIPVIDDPSAGSTTITRLVEGDYSFNYKVSGVPGTLNVTITNRDLDDLPLYPSNALLGTETVSFDLASVLNAADVSIDVRKPDGNLLTPVVCTVSPCPVITDNRQDAHSYRKKYRNSSGVVLTTGDWTQFPMRNRIPQPNPYMANGGNTFASYGEYLTFNLINLPSTRKFLGKRIRVAGLPEVSPVGEFADFSRAHLTLYIDSRAEYPYEMPNLRNIVAPYGWHVEDMFLHSNRNIAFMHGQSFWRDMERLDHYQDNNGVFLKSTGAVLTNASTAAYDETLNDVVMSSTNPELILLNGEPFDKIFFKYSTARSGGSIQWQYSTGAGTWSNLTLASDTTSGLTVTGTDVGFTFLPPVDWVRVSIGSPTHPQYAVRAVVTGASTYPTFSRVYGDDYRIWDRTTGRVTLSSTGTVQFVGTVPDASPYVNGKRILLNPNFGCPFQNRTVAPTITLNGGATKKLYMWVEAVGGGTPLPIRQDYLTQTASGYDCAANVPITLKYEDALDGGAGGYSLHLETRGWCNVDGSGSDRYTSNNGEWVYDPTPGSNCTANFRHYARFLFGWAPNNFQRNFDDIQGGQRTSARYIVERTKPYLEAVPRQYNGIYLDDVSWPQPDPAQVHYPVAGQDALSWTEQNISGVAPTESQMYDKLELLTADVLSYQRAYFPDGKVIQNSHVWRQVSKGTGGLFEWGAHIHNSRNWRYTINSDTDTNHGGTNDILTPFVPGYGGEGFDRFYGSNATTASGEPAQSVHIYIDSTSEYENGSTNFFYWDRGNRGPMTGLALYYMGATLNTSFCYVQTALAVYFQNDNYTYWDATESATLTAQLNQALNTSTPKTMTGDFSAFPAGTDIHAQIIAPNGDMQRIIVDKVNDTTATAAFWAVVGYNFPIGSKIYLHKFARASQLKQPPPERVYYYGSYYPARDIDVGVNDTSSTALLGDTNTAGIPQRGFRKYQWYTPAAAGMHANVGGVMRRDLTKAIMLYATGWNLDKATYYNTYSNVLTLNDAAGNPLRVWPLRANGKTDGNFCGPAVTVQSDGSCLGEIQIRHGEGLVLMKAPIN